MQINPSSLGFSDAGYRARVGVSTAGWSFAVVVALVAAIFAIGVQLGVLGL